MGTLSRKRSEVSYLLGETSHGKSPKARKRARKMQRKLLRATDQMAIAIGLRDHEIERAEARPKIPNAREGIDELIKQIQVDSMWHNHEIDEAEAEADDRWRRNRYPYEYHDTDSWDQDTSWHEDAKEFLEG